MEHWPSKTNVAVIVLILTVAIGADYLSEHYVSQMPAKNTSASQQVILPKSQPTPTPAPTEPPKTAQLEVSPITINSSPAAGNDFPASNLKLNLYREDPSRNHPEIFQAINWSTTEPLSPGQKINSSTVYFRNEGNVPITMYLSTSDWGFTDLAGNSLSQNYSRYFTLSWDYDNSTIGINEIRPITFTLAISQNITDVASFSFKLVVTITP